ncbi:cytochrome bd-I oxidase subunit CydX [Aquirhabdus parva]|uniref:Cytochrome bd-I oxidase subunit CydX n=1 Tax=Aquirhabdus parva TaxID=2283318 RepID=A0A345P9W2_9GAMM|nr:cytochrome bd-I oxidase subunit CydX [Aquirhabdus parva]AXI04071.1 cytochrome bd-I oxidase subunit CydX [Aquirhabdus parva]
MWYFTWVLGVSFAIFLAILNGMWGEHEKDRLPQDPSPDQ